MPSQTKLSVLTKNEWALLILLMLFSAKISTAGSNINEQTALASYQLAQQSHLASDNDLALQYLNEAITAVDTCNFQEIIDIYLLRSTIYSKLTLFEEAMEDAVFALSISETHQLTANKAQALLCIGGIHYLMYNDEKAEEFFLRAKSLAEENSLSMQIMQASGKLGELYKATGRLDEALPLLSRTLEMAQNQSDTLYMITYLRVLGDYYITLNRWTNPIIKEYQFTAKNYLDQALDLALEKNVPAYINQIYSCLIRWSRVEQNYTQALAYAQEVIQNSATNDYSLLIQIYDHLVAIYAHLGNVEMVIQSQQDFRTMMIKQSDLNLHRSMQEMTVKYETAQKELQIEHQLAEISRQKSRKNMYLGGLSLAGVLLVMLIYVAALRIRRNRELTEMNATKDKFFSIISHDLKNPAIAQRNALQLLVEHSENWDSASRSDYHQKLLKSADTQVGLLGNLLNWAQVQTGRMPFLPIEFDLTEALRPDIDLIKEMAENKGLIFNIQMPDTAFVTGDEIMITTVVRNLLTNAIKFSQALGVLSLSITLTSPTYTISISDTGIGMSPQQISDLFHIDRTHSHRGTSGEQGSGLGLIVCKELLQKHGSNLYVESKEGHGTRFWFMLPKA